MIERRHTCGECGKRRKCKAFMENYVLWFLCRECREKELKELAG